MSFSEGLDFWLNLAAIPKLFCSSALGTGVAVLLAVIVLSSLMCAPHTLHSKGLGVTY